MGGKIWVESHWGEGSTFTFTLPTGEDNETQQRIPTAGCTGYIDKPINLDMFVTRVEAHLPGGKIGRGGGA